LFSKKRVLENCEGEEEVEREIGGREG